MNKKQQAEIEKDDLFLVEKILDKKKFGNCYKYKIKWQGYPIDKATWEPIENLQSCLDYVTAYEETLKNDEKGKNKNKSKDQNLHPTPTSHSKNGPKIKNNSKISTRSRRTDPDSQSPEELSDCENDNNKMIIDDEPIISSDNKNKSIINTSQQILTRTKLKNSIVLAGGNKKESIYNFSHIDNLSSNGNKKQKNSSSLSNTNCSSTGLLNSVNHLPEEEFEPKGVLGKDTPIKILTAKQHEEKDNYILCDVEWGRRLNGYLPEISQYTNFQLKKVCPELLCEFYESRMRFPNKRNGNIK